ncbi:MAG: LamG-like jellyroll fold domain-containing protein [Acidobacteriota bacterium]
MHCRSRLLSVFLSLFLLFSILYTPLFATSYEYDAANRLKSVTNDNGDKVTYEYDNNGNLKSVRHSGAQGVRATGVSLNQHSLNLVAGGDTATVTASVYPTNAAYKDVTWSTNNAQIAAVTNGVVTPGIAGTATITAKTKDGGFVDTCTITVTLTQVNATGMTLDQHSLTLTERGATATLTPTFTPKNTTNKKITWNSSKNVVATVYDGVVTPLASGTTIITASAVYGGYQDTCAVNVSWTGEPYNKLMLHMDGTENGTAFTDQCGKIIQTAGNTCTKTSDKKFGLSSAAFDGNGDYLSIKNTQDFDIENGDYTIDFWVYLKYWPGPDNYYTVFSNAGPSGNRGMYFTLGNQNKVDWEVWNGTAYTSANYSKSLNINTWNHFALVKEGNSLKIYENGILKATQYYSGYNRSGYPLLIGGFSTNNYINGYIDEFRMSKAIARWTANFTPPIAAYGDSSVPVTSVVLDKHNLSLNGPQTSQLVANVSPSQATNKAVVWSSNNFNVVKVQEGQLTPVAPGSATISVRTEDGGFSDTCQVNVTGDPRTKLILHMDGTDNGTTFTDEAGKTITVNGNVCTRTGTKKIGTASAYFDGNGDYLSIANSEDWNFGSNDFTIDCWVKLNNISDHSILLGQWSDTSDVWILGLNNHQSQGLFFACGGIVSPLEQGNLNGWDTTAYHHVAVVRAGSTMKLYLDGTCVSTTTNNGKLSNTLVPLEIGRYSYNGGSGYVNGYIDEVHIVNGTACWTNNFTPPTVPYSSVSIPVTQVTLDRHQLDLTSSGSPATIIASVYPANASYNVVTWASSNTAVATVKDGIVTPIQNGTATITASVLDGTIKDTCSVNVSGTTSAQTVLLMHMDGINYGTQFNDETGKQIIRKGEVYTKTTLKKFGTASAFISGNNTGWLNVPDSADFDLSTSGSYTIDFWFYLPKKAEGYVWSINNEIECYVSSMYDCLWISHFDGQPNDGGGGKTITYPTLNKWHHVAFVNNNGKKTLYLDGIAQVSNNCGNDASRSSGLFIGKRDDGYGINGPIYIDEFRVSKGIARWTSNYTAPAIPYNTPQVSGIELNTHSIAFNGEKTIQLSAAVQPADAFNKTFYWTTSNPSIVLVDNGVLTPIGLGTAQVTVKTQNGGFTDTCTVTVNSAVEPYNKLLMHMDGSDNGTIFNDETGKTAIVNGSVCIKTGTKKFGTAGAYFNGSNSYISLADSEDWNFGNNDFTIDCWVKLNNINKHAIIAGQWDNSSSVWLLGMNNNANKGLFFGCGGYQGTVPFEQGNLSGWDTTAFHHVAVVRSGSTWNMYLDGKCISSINNPNAFPNTSASLEIGRYSYNGGAGYLDGYMDELRISKGLARWTGNFALPSLPWNKMIVPAAGVSLDKHTATIYPDDVPSNLATAVTPADATYQGVLWSSSNPAAATVKGGIVSRVSAGTTTITGTTIDGGKTDTCVITSLPYDRYTSLMLHMDGSDSGTTFTDEIGKSITRSGDVCTRNIMKKFGSSSAYFDGGGDYLTVANSPDFSIGSGDYTIDFWINLNTWPGPNDYCVPFGNLGPSGNKGMYLTLGNQNKVDWEIWNGSTFISTNYSGTLSPGTWYHFACVKQGNNLAIYENGVLKATQTFSGAAASDYPLSIGGVSGGNFVNGYIDEFRVSKGIARWTDSFIPPNKPHGPQIAVTGVSLDKHTMSLSAGGGAGNLLVTTTPTNASNQNVTWSSSNTAIATVNNGVVTSGAIGTATITVTTQDGAKTDTCVVTTTEAPYDSYTKLLLHLDGYDNSQSFTDMTAKSISKNGDACTKTAIKKFGTASGSFDGNGDYLQLANNPDLSPGNGDFTIDFWINLKSWRGPYDYSTIFCNSGPYGNRGMYLTMGYNNEIQWNLYNGSTWVTASYSRVLSTNTWNHFAFVKEGSILKIYENGILQTTRSFIGTNLSDYPFLIGGFSDSSFVNGYIDEFRISKGIARWTGNFTPPTAQYGPVVSVTGVTLNQHSLSLTAGGATGALTATVAPVSASNQGVSWTSSNLAVASVANGIVTPIGAGNTTITVTTQDGGKNDSCTVTVAAPPYDLDTKLLLHMDGNDNGTSFTDVTGKTVTRNDSTCTKTATKKFGSASGYFDGNGDYLQLANNTDFNPGTGDFTVDFWVNLKTWPGPYDYCVPFANSGPYGNKGMYMTMGYNDQIIWNVWNGSAWVTASYSRVLSTNTWYHFALVKQGSTLKIYENGVLQGTQGFSGSNSSDYPLLIGGFSTCNYVNGYIDEFRISKVARWTTNFTPPAAPY